MYAPTKKVSRMTSAQQFDALIIGGGPAGAATAVLLAKAGWSVAVIEKARFPRRKVCGEFLSATNLPVLRELGVAEAFSDLAGPPIKSVGLFAGTRMLRAPMPRPPWDAGGFGRACGREHLDTLLLARAAQVGASMWQPWTAEQLSNDGKQHICRIVSKATRAVAELRAPIIIAAHGSWERGSLPTQPMRIDPRPSDLLGFKAHFRQCALPSDLMPLFVFSGGYGGMVHTDGNRVSLSLCVRRDRLERCRRAMPQAYAGAAVLAHIRQSCRGVRESLARAVQEGEWLSTGPIRPGIRRSPNEAIFLIGNAAGEAHPVIAEGISMAIQSAWLVCEHLIAHRAAILANQSLEEVAAEYWLAWQRSFAARIRAAALFAHWAMRPALVNCLLPVISFAPGLLTACAHWSGKAREIHDWPCGPRVWTDPNRNGMPA